MSGLDVEALLDSTATNDVKDKSSPHDGKERRRTDRRDRDKHRDGSRDRERDRKKRDRSRDREHRRDRDDEMKSPKSDHGSANGSHRSSRRRSRSVIVTKTENAPSEMTITIGDVSRSPEYDRYYRPGGRSRRDDEDHRPRARQSQRPTSLGKSQKAEKSRLPSHNLLRMSVIGEPCSSQQLLLVSGPKELIQFFEKVGPVNEAQIVKDRVSGRSKGEIIFPQLLDARANTFRSVGYVEFKNEDSVQLAIQMTGQKLLGIPIIAQLTEAEKNRQARNPEAQSSNHNSVPFHRPLCWQYSTSASLKQICRMSLSHLESSSSFQLQKEERGSQPWVWLCAVCHLPIPILHPADSG